MHRRAGIAITACLALAACAPAGSPTGSPTPSTLPPSPTGRPSATASASPTAAPEPVALGRVRVDAKGATVVGVGEGRATRDATGATRLTRSLGALQGPTIYELGIAPVGAEVVVHGGVATFNDTTGSPVVAMPLPVVVDEADEPVAVTMSVVDGRVQVEVTPDEQTEGALTMTVWVGRDLIDRVVVDEEEGAPRYTIVRTAFGHALLGGGLGSPGAREWFEEVGWRQALELEPALASPESVHQQFDCHVLGAPSKEEWHLEAFRPDFPDWLPGAVQHRCNWTADDVGQEPETSPTPSPSSSPTR